jgi:hypothetical protein
MEPKDRQAIRYFTPHRFSSSNDRIYVRVRDFLPFPDLLAQPPRSLPHAL